MHVGVRRITRHGAERSTGLAAVAGVSFGWPPRGILAVALSFLRDIPAGFRDLSNLTKPGDPPSCASKPWLRSV